LSGSGVTHTRLGDAFGAVFAIERAGSQEAFIVGKERLRDVLSFLKGDESLLYVMMTDLFAVDLSGLQAGAGKPRFEVVYLLNSLKLKERIVVKVRVNEGEAVPTVSDLWRAAEWLEREAYDMFGIPFENHPDLRRILMVEDFDGYPLRKDFPTEGYGFEEPFKVDLESESTPGGSGAASKKAGR
jgi:NADH-quinone oxidoreductase subunit C